MADSTLTIKQYDPFKQLFVRPWETFSPSDQATITDTINLLVQNLNRLGKLSNDVVTDWNNVMQWFQTDGTTTLVDNILQKWKDDGTFQLMVSSISTIGDVTTLQTTAKDNVVHAINENVGQIALKANQSDLDTTNANVTTNAALLAERTTIEINVISPPAPLSGAVGDGVTDDTAAIQAIINYAQSLIKDLGISVGIIGGAPTIRFPSKTFRITGLLTCTDTVNFQGTGVNSILYLDGTNAGLSIVCNNDSTSINRYGWHSPGLWVRDLKFASKRHVSITSALTLGNIDFPLIDNLYFWGIKGSAIQLQTVRQHQINNIYADYCGTDTYGVLEHITPKPTQESTNLGLCVNWQFINNYGSAIKLLNGMFTLTNYCFHGCIAGDGSRASLFGVDDYNTSGSDQLYLQGSGINLNNGTSSWIANTKSFIHLDNSSANITNCYSAGNHYSQNEAHGDTNQIFTLINSSYIYFMGDNIGLQTYLAGDMFSCDATSKLYGNLVSKRASDYLNAKVSKQIVASEIVLSGEKSSQVVIKPPDGFGHNATFNQWVDSGDIGINTQWELHDINGNVLMYIGQDSTTNNGIIAVGSGTEFKLPVNVTANMGSARNTIWLDSINYELKINQHGTIKTYQSVNSGTTANRPTGRPSGYMYLDTTLNKPVWYTGTVWIDATGATV